MAWLHKLFGHRKYVKAGSPDFTASREPMKMVLVGDPGAGKTRLQVTLHFGHEEATRIYEDEFICPANLIDLQVLKSLVNGKTWNFLMYDTKGCEDYDRLRPLAYPLTDIFLVFFSVVEPEAVNNITEKWLPEIHHYCPTTPFALIGTKTDLRDVNDVTTSHAAQNAAPTTLKSGRNLARRLGAIGYFEYSSLEPDLAQAMVNEVLQAYRLYAKNKKVYCR